MISDMQAQKTEVAAWFWHLREQICASFEELEDRLSEGPHADMRAGRFERSRTERKADGSSNAGGGEMSVMRGRVFEKVAVNVSEVFGKLDPLAQRSMAARNVPGLKDDPRFWASGISLVAHMRSPKVPAVHMNTRMFWTPGMWWFGGGGDLNPMVPDAADTAHFHGVYKSACDAHDPDYYPRFKKWADDYFMIPHRGFARGVGGIFYDDLNTGDWRADFAFTQDVGRAFLAAFVPLVERHMHTPWNAAEREHQLVRRGYYAEFNLVYDRGTKFGLQTGHNIEAVLMSMPPEAKWP